jgi:hypothetical protein
MTTTTPPPPTEARRRNRGDDDAAVADIRDTLAAGGEVEILSGVCAPMVIKTKADFQVYKRKLWAWYMEGL